MTALPSTTRTAVKHQVNGLTVTEWPGTGPTVFGLPGLGSSGGSWLPLAEDLPDARVLSVDLRGRGEGQGMTGPTGMLAHAQDVAGILEALDLSDVVLVGHSLGAFLAPLVAQEAPTRVRKIVGVDGGIRPAFPFFMGPRLTKLAFTKQLSSMDREWAGVEAVGKKAKLDKVVAAQPELRPRILAMLTDEMAASPNGTLRPRVDTQRAVADAVDAFFGPDVLTALENLAVPTLLLLAENKMWEGNKPFISDEAVAPWLAKNPLLTVKRLRGNHITVVFAPEVLAAVTS